MKKTCIQNNFFFSMISRMKATNVEWKQGKLPCGKWCYTVYIFHHRYCVLICSLLLVAFFYANTDVCVCVWVRAFTIHVFWIDMSHDDTSNMFRVDNVLELLGIVLLSQNYHNTFLSPITICISLLYERDMYVQMFRRQRMISASFRNLKKQFQFLSERKMCFLRWIEVEMKPRFIFFGGFCFIRICICTYHASNDEWKVYGGHVIDVCCLYLVPCHYKQYSYDLHCKKSKCRVQISSSWQKLRLMQY